MPKKKSKGDPEVEAAIEACEEVFGDTSVSKEKTLKRMQEIRSHIDTSIDCLKQNIEAEQES